MSNERLSRLQKWILSAIHDSTLLVPESRDAYLNCHPGEQYIESKHIYEGYYGLTDWREGMRARPAVCESLRRLRESGLIVQGAFCWYSQVTNTIHLTDEGRKKLIFSH